MLIAHVGLDNEHTKQHSDQQVQASPRVPRGSVVDQYPGRVPRLLRPISAGSFQSPGHNTRGRW